MKQSAGTLLYRWGDAGLEVLLVHASGAYNRRAPWGIPKGLLEPDEEMQATARRETLEETGVRAGELAYLGSMEYKRSRKRIHCFAGPAPEAARPRPSSWEVDGAELVTLSRARELIHPDQAVFLDLLVEALGRAG
jgi:8-oxo-dGTP pyrophosphatase MutT (NUDIX family)